MKTVLSTMGLILVFCSNAYAKEVFLLKDTVPLEDCLSMQNNEKALELPFSQMTIQGQLFDQRSWYDSKTKKIFVLNRDLAPAGISVGLSCAIYE